LKRNLKKNSIRGKLIFPLFFLLITVFQSEAISAQIEIESSPELTIYHKIHDVDVSALFDSLDQGYQSQIYLQIRLYKKKTLPYSLFGDELIENLKIYKDADVDIFSKNYNLSNNKSISYFENKLSFLTSFLNHEIKVPGDIINVRELDSYYVKIRATLIKKIYLQPFNILHLTNFNDLVTTGWLYRDFTQE